MYMTDSAVASAVKAKAAAGVAVRVLLGDPAWVTSNTQTAQDLAAAKIPVRYFKVADLHAKLVLVDDAAFVGSENLSTNSLDHNREVGVMVTNKAPLDAIRVQFEKDWGVGVSAP